VENQSHSSLYSIVAVLKKMNQVIVSAPLSHKPYQILVAYSNEIRLLNLSQIKSFADKLYSRTCIHPRVYKLWSCFLLLQKFRQNDIYTSGEETDGTLFDDLVRY
jgi:hypothetical protein